MDTATAPWAPADEASPWQPPAAEGAPCATARASQPASLAQRHRALARCALALGALAAALLCLGLRPEPALAYLTSADRGSIEVSFEVPVAFATWCEEDCSVHVYKRPEMPQVGDVYEGRTVDWLYLDFEHEPYEPKGNDFVVGTVGPPWVNSARQGAYNRSNKDVRTQARLIVIEDPLSPRSLVSWFALRALRSTPEAPCGILGLEKLDLSHCTSMEGAFYAYCLLEADGSYPQDLSSLPPLDLRGLDVAGIQNLNRLFESATCSAILTEGWDTRSVISLSRLFLQSRIPRIDISSWVLPNPLSPVQICYNLFATTELKLPPMRCVASLRNAFYGMDLMEELDLSMLWVEPSAEGVLDVGNLTMYCPKLRTVYVNGDWDVSMATNSAGVVNNFYSPLLVGGNGTRASDVVGTPQLELARADLPDQPGLFTLKPYDGPPLPW